jgi:hypothetical protein
MKIISFLETRINTDTIHKEISELLVNHQLVVFKKGKIPRKFRQNHKYASFLSLNLHYKILKPSLNLDLITQAASYRASFLRLYERFNQNLSNKPYTELETIYRRYLKYSESIVDSKDSLLIFSDIPHSPVEYIFYIYAKVNNIKMIFFNMLPRLNQHSGWPHFISNDFTPDVQDYINLINEYSQNSNDFNVEKTEDEFLYYLDMFNNPSSKKEIMVLDRIQLKHYYELILSTFFNVTSFRNLLVKFIKGIKGFIISPIEKYVLLTTLKKLEKNEIPEGFEILYYPLHMQPEATVIPAGNELYDQLIIIDEISRAMTDNQILLVKEHPATLSVKSIAQPELRYPYRSVNFYKTISKYSNVVLISRNIPSEKIIRKSRFIFTIRGSVTLESLMLNKPVILFGDSLYNSFPNTLRYESFTQLESTLRDEKIGEEFNPYPVLRFLSENSYFGYENANKSNSFRYIVKIINDMAERREK